MNLRLREGRPLVIGHRGAARVAPENTLEGLSAAIAAGADLVEFDVAENLCLGHPGVAHAGEPVTLDGALSFLEGSELGILIDLKAIGIESQVCAAVRGHGLEARTHVSTTWARSLRRIALEEPAIGRAISYPRDRLGAARFAWPRPVVRASAATARAAMRGRAPLLLRSSGADAVALHHALISRAVVAGIHARGAAVIAWTINDPANVARAARLRVDAIVSDDPKMVFDVLGTLEAP